MNKSTPLNQLPSATAQPSFINEQQKQMITNAQAAIQTMNLPQNTQTSADIINDDDPTIQELLNQINVPQNGGNQNIQTLQQPAYQPNIQMGQMGQMSQMGQLNQMGQVNQLSHQISQPGTQNTPSQQSIQGFQNDYTGDYLQQYISMSNTNQQTPTITPPLSNNFELFLNFFGEDIKIALIVLMVVIIINFIPISGILGKYIAIDKIPYHDILLKGILAALLVTIIKKITKN